MKKKLTMVAALVLVFALGVTGTLAYLTAKTNTITNTFTVGNVAITLTEHQYDETNTTSAKMVNNQLVPVTNSQTYPLIPGTIYYKDPTVAVDAASEDCWLFVKFEESNTTYLSYESELTADNGWTQGEGTGDGKDGIPTNVWYREVKKNDTAKSWGLLAGSAVEVNTSVTNGVTDAPSLAYTAYAAQSANLSAASAWTQVKNLT